MIAEYHPHTVRTSHTPLYMQGIGFVGDDGSGFDFTSPSAGDAFTPSDNLFLDTGSVAPIPVAPVLPGDVFTYSPGFTPNAPIIVPPGQFDPNPLDYTSQQAAINAGVPPATAAAAWANPAAYGGGGVPGTSAAAVATQAAAAAARSIATLGPGASPRVATYPPGYVPPSSFTSLLTASSIIPGLPNIAIIGGALLLVMAAGKR
jgi:hypothetical protein